MTDSNNVDIGSLVFEMPASQNSTADDLIHSSGPENSGRTLPEVSPVAPHDLISHTSIAGGLPGSAEQSGAAQQENSVARVPVTDACALPNSNLAVAAIIASPSTQKQAAVQDTRGQHRTHHGGQASGGAGAGGSSEQNIEQSASLPSHHAHLTVNKELQTRIVTVLRDFIADKPVDSPLTAVLGEVVQPMLEVVTAVVQKTNELQAWPTWASYSRSHPSQSEFTGTLYAQTPVGRLVETAFNQHRAQLDAAVAKVKATGRGVSGVGVVTRAAHRAVEHAMASLVRSKYPALCAPMNQPRPQRTCARRAVPIVDGDDVTTVGSSEYAVVTVPSPFASHLTATSDRAAAILAREQEVTHEAAEHRPQSSELRSDVDALGEQAFDNSHNDHVPPQQPLIFEHVTHAHMLCSGIRKIECGGYKR